MQQFLVCLIFILLGNAIVLSEARQDTVEKSGQDCFDLELFFNGILERVRSRLPDPLKIDFLPITLPGGMIIIRGDLNISNLVLTGLKDFKVKSVKCDTTGTKLNATFLLPSINLTANYSTNLDVGGQAFYGSGDASVHIEDGEIQTISQVDTSHGLAIQNVRVQIFVGSVTFDIHGMLDDEEISSVISQSLSNIIPTFINNNQDIVSNLVSPVVEGMLNALLTFDNANASIKHPNVI